MPRRKHEGTLRRVAMDAQNNYSEYKRHHKLEDDYIARHPDEVREYLEPTLGQAATGRLFSWGDWTQDNVERVSSKRDTAAGAKHFKEHEAEYHDLAVIDAHLEGVTINVQQPLEIGQKIEVRVDQKK
jgi:hypothetical protein